ncbi:MAG: tetratricopeptide (TPR) repeat protein [Candidatus Azotimanducaceae bacterium]|jgi:tetratricopeptide (TPR) repeat protein
MSALLTSSLQPATRLMGALVWLLLVSGCSFIQVLPSLDFSKAEYRSDEKNVADVLDEVLFSDSPVALSHTPGTTEVLALYEAVVGKIKNDARRFEVASRIAELELAAATYTLGDRDQVSFQKAIGDLEALVKLSSINTSHPEHLYPEKAKLHYQLSQAYDLSGDQASSIKNLSLALEVLALSGGDTSSSIDLKLELAFRRAEYYFSEGQLREAAEDYAMVAEVVGTYQTHAKYMLGWSRFKQGDLDLALAAFISTLDQLLSKASLPSGLKESLLDGAPSVSRSLNKTRANTELLDDTRRISIITLDYLDGVESLASEMAAKGKPDWQVYLYRSLADWYQEKERFQDSALTWETFLNENPLYVSAPAISLEVIEIYRRAGFVDDIEGRKLTFINRYDKQSAFYQQHGEAVFADYSVTLLNFIDGVVAQQHADAQAMNSLTATAVSTRLNNLSVTEKYIEVAGWYRRWLLNFDGHNRSPDMTMLLAEALRDGADPRGSVLVYQSLMSNHPDFDRLEQAAYAVVVGLESIYAESSYAEGSHVERIDAGLFFARRYPNSPEAPATMVNVASILFDLEKFSRAQAIAEESLSIAPLYSAQFSNSGLWNTALRIAAHSGFEIGEYATAEIHYHQLLANVPHDGELKAKLLATILKQADRAQSNGENTEAITHLARLSTIDRVAPLAIAAQFDIAALYEKSGDIASAINQLTRFKKNHPRYPGVEAFPMRLVSLHEAIGNDLAAARELLQISKSAGSYEVRRQALFRAGELFLAANNEQFAIGAFRDYSHTYTLPFTTRMEAMNQMDLLYHRSGEPGKRRFWLRKKKNTFDKTSKHLLTERTRFLAADAAFVLALDRREVFEKVVLKQPLKKSLKRKQKSMTDAISAFEQTADYGVEKYTTGATFQIASIYASLALALMDSDKPANLNELEREQYDILLEEQAYPFEEQALNIHQLNLQRGWDASWDQWVSRSLEELAQLSPGRFKRDEIGVGYAKALY